MTDTTYDPTKNSIAAQVQAETDVRNGSAPRDTTTWNYSSQLAYENEWNKNKAP